MSVTMRNAFSKAVLSLVFSLFVLSIASYAQNQVLGEVQFVSKTKLEKTSGVWIDGQYVGYVEELKDDKKVLLLPGEHQISVRQSGYMDFTQKVVGEPEKNVVLHVTMQKDPRAQFPTVTSQLKLQVTPERAAVFLDDGFVGTVHEFSGVGRGMLVSPREASGQDRFTRIPGFRERGEPVTAPENHDQDEPGSRKHHPGRSFDQKRTRSYLINVARTQEQASLLQS